MLEAWSSHGARTMKCRMPPWVSCAVLVLALGVAPPGRAETLYRCVGAHGAVSYQNTTCGAHSRLDRTLDYRPDAEPVAPAETRLYRYQPRFRSYPARFRSRGRQRRSVAPAPSVVCQAARERRRTELERIGLRRTFSQLSQLDASVRAVCRGY